MGKRRIYRCEDCGAVLDAGERCECEGSVGKGYISPTKPRPVAVTRPRRKQKWKPTPGTEAARVWSQGR